MKSQIEFALSEFGTFEFGYEVSPRTSSVFKIWGTSQVDFRGAAKVSTSFAMTVQSEAAFNGAQIAQSNIEIVSFSGTDFRSAVLNVGSYVSQANSTTEFKTNAVVNTVLNSIGVSTVNWAVSYFSNLLFRSEGEAISRMNLSSICNTKLQVSSLSSSNLYSNTLSASKLTSVGVADVILRSGKLVVGGFTAAATSTFKAKVGLVWIDMPDAWDIAIRPNEVRITIRPTESRGVIRPDEIRYALRPHQPNKVIWK